MQLYNLAATCFLKLIKRRLNMKTGSTQASIKVDWAGSDPQVQIGQEERAHAVEIECLLLKGKGLSRF